MALSRWRGMRIVLYRPHMFYYQSAHFSTNVENTPVRVRYAPSPTGYLHLGGLRTALFNYLFAKSTGGKFILRIEDTDKTRQVPGSIEALIDSLQWCGIYEDEGPNRSGPCGPYIQSQRLDKYQEHANRLVESGHAYRCFCSSERLAALRESQSRHGESKIMYDRACLGLTDEDVAARVARNEPHTIRFRVPEGKTVVNDLLRGYVQFDHSVIDDQVLIKSDGYPTYHLANVVDDHAMKISHVIRGEEWLTSTPKHLLLYKALGFSPPKFAHLGLLLNEDRTKLSKRQGDVAVEDFQNKGYLASGLVNFVALLGWHPSAGDNQEIFDMNQLHTAFSLDNVNKAGSVVNVERLQWINSRHIRSLFAVELFDSDEALATHKRQVLDQVQPFLSKALGEAIPTEYTDDYVWRAMELMKERVAVLPDFGPLCIPFFRNPDLSSTDAIAMKSKYITDQTGAIIEGVIKRLQALEPTEFTADRITKEIKVVAKEHKLGLKQVLMPVRYYLTGMEVGAGLGDTIVLLGKETVIRRLQ